MTATSRLVVSASQQRELARLLAMDEEVFGDLVDRHRRAFLRGGLGPDTEWALRQDEVLDLFLSTIRRNQRAIRQTIRGARLEMDAAQHARDHVRYAEQAERCRKAELAGEGAQAQAEMVGRLLADRKRRRHAERQEADAFGAALRRLREAHEDEFTEYLAEERAKRAAP